MTSLPKQLLLQMQDSFLLRLEGLLSLLLLSRHGGVQALCLSRCGQHDTKKLHVAITQTSQHSCLFTTP